MPTDYGITEQSSSLQRALRALIVYGRAKGRVPGFHWSDRIAHWALRIPLVGLLLYYGLQKFPSSLVAPGDYGVPAVLYILAAFVVVSGATALILGGIVETWRPKPRTARLAGDALTRAGGFAGVTAVAGWLAISTGAR